ncbi:MAG: hypothetical protein ACM3JG_04330 [Thiohalocapsa sp.]
MAAAPAPERHPAGSSAGAATAAPNSRVAELEQQLRERDAEIARLRARLGRGGSATADEAGAASTAASPAAALLAGPPAGEAPPEPQPLGEAPGKPAAAATRPGQDETRALERALVRQAGAVLPQGLVEVEPEFDYLYNEPAGGRRDTLISSVALRTGLPWRSQVEVSVPYVLYDKQTGLGAVSGVGDAQLSFTHQLTGEAAFLPELLATLRWKSNSGHSQTNPPTGTGSNTLQGTLVALKRQDPVVLLANLSYTHSLDHGRADIGDYVGGKLGAFLAATPDTTLFFDVDANSTYADRSLSTGTNRLVGVAEFGAAMVLSRASVLDLTGGIGFTRQAPRFRLSVSLPTRF